MSVPEHKVRVELAAAGIELIGPLPGVGGTARARGIGKDAANRACAVTVLLDRVLWFDHSSQTPGVIWLDRPGAPRRTPTREEAAEIERVSRLAAEQRAERHRAGTAAAAQVWFAAQPASMHPYLQRKGIAVKGLRVDGAGALLVPRHDVDGKFAGLQRIEADGTKRYAPGAPTRATFFLIGAVDPAGTLCIVEGLATAATVHAKTGHPCAVGFDCGNLKAVATLLRAKYTAVRVVLCADDDRQTPGNPGRTKAIEAARAVGGYVALPPLCRCCTCTDFNDAAACARRRDAR